MAFFQSAVGTLQTLVVALGAGLGIWGAINLMEGYGNDNPGAKSQGMMVIMMPFFFMAMYEKNGQPVEVILHHMIQAIFIRPKQRPYKTDNYYDALARQAEVEQEICRIQACSLAEQAVRKSRTGKQGQPAEGTFNVAPASCSAKQNKTGGRVNCSNF